MEVLNAEDVPPTNIIKQALISVSVIVGLLEETVQVVVRKWICLVEWSEQHMLEQPQQTL